MKKLICLIVCVVLMAAATARAGTVYVGSLTGGGGGITAVDAWDSTATTFSWTVTDKGEGLWNYSYIFVVPSRDISHLIIELTENLPKSWVENVETNVPIENNDFFVGWNEEGGGNPNLPSSVYGVKFDLDADSTTFQVAFDVKQAPVWGDFYAKDGEGTSGFIYAYNTGFGLNDQSEGPSNGSFLYQILRPNGNGGPFEIPTPSAFVGLIGMGLIGLVIRRRYSR